MSQTDVGIRVVVLGAAQASRILGNVRDDLSRFASNIATHTSAVEQFGRSVVKVGDAVSSLGRTMTYTITAPTIGALGALTNAGIQFEDAFAGVSKTVDGVALGFNDIATQMYGTSKGLSEAQKQAVFANENFGKLTEIGEQLSSEFRDLSRDIPISAAELSQVAQVSGQLGVEANQIVAFTKTMALLGTTTDLSAEQAAFAIARFANIMGVSQDDISSYASEMGNAIVALGNNAAATESEITNLALRLGAAGRQAGLSAPDILGLSASLAEMGVKAERGGTAVSRVIYEMIFAISDGGENLASFAQIAGLSASEFASKFKGDALGTLDLFLTRLSDLQDQGQISADTLTALGLSGVRVREVLNILGPNIQSVRDNVDLANQAWTEQIALQEEATKRFKTIKSMIQLAKNALTDLGITIFDLVKDDLAKMIQGISTLVDGFKALDPTIQKTIIRVGLLVAAIGPLLLIGGTLLQIVGNNIIGFGKLQAMMGLLIPSFDLFGKKQKDAAKGGGFISAIFGKITGVLSGATGALPKLFGKLGTGLGGFFISSFISPIKLGIPNVLKAFNPLFGGIVKKIKDGYLAMKGLAGFWVKTFENAFKGITTTVQTFLKPLSLLFKTFASVIAIPIEIISKTFTSVVGAFGKIFTSVFSGLIGIVGQLGGKLLSTIPILGKFLFSGIVGTFTKLPLILGGIFALLFAPKVIKAVIKNRDALFDELKVGFTQFGEDIKSLGLEKSILLFFGGGSTGSGRRGGIYGIAKALGASEDSAQKFAYAMGTSAYWVIKIVKDTKVLVSRMVSIATASDRLGTSTKSTSDRLSSFAGGLAKFLEGLSIGWLGSFDNILSAFTVFVSEVKRAVGSVGKLFDAIFGGAAKATEGVSSFYDELEPGAENTAMRVGATVGEVIGGLVTLTIQGLTFVTTIAGVVANALTGIVTAYNEGGIVGVFEELGPLLAGIFNGFIAAAGTLWTSIEPSVSSFIDTFTQWMINTGAPALWAGAKSMFGVIRDALDAALFGTEEVVQEVVTGYRFEFKSGAYAGEAPLDYMNDIRSPFATNPEEFNREEVFGTQVVPAKEGLIAKIGRLIDDVQAYLTSEETKEKLRSAFQTALSAAGDVLSYLWEGGEGFDGLHSYLSDLIDNVGNWFTSDGGPRFRAGGSYMWQEFKRGLIDAATGAAGIDSLPLGLDKFFENGIEEATNLDRSYEDFLNQELSNVTIDTTSLASTVGAAGGGIGKSMTDGIKAAITTEQENVNTTVDTMATGMINATKGRLAIKSPSRVFYDIGKNVMSGLIMALKETGVLQMAMDNVTNLFSTFGNAIINAMLPVKNELINFMSMTSTLLGSVGSIVTALATITNSIMPTSQQMNSLLLSTNTLLSSLGGLGMALGGLSIAAPVAGAVTTTNYNNYSPSISGSSINPVKANEQMFNGWLNSQGKYG